MLENNRKLLFLRPELGDPSDQISRKNYLSYYLFKYILSERLDTKISRKRNLRTGKLSGR